jgi:hypothetical protein
LSVSDRVSSARAGAGIIGVVKIGAKVRIAVGAEAGIATETIGVVGAGAKAGMAVGAEAGIATETIGVVGAGAKAGIAVSAKAGMKVSAEAKIATAEEIRRTGLIVRVFERFKVKVVSSGES